MNRRTWRAVPLAAAAGLLALIATHRPPRPIVSAAIGLPFPPLALAIVPGIRPLRDVDLRTGPPTLVNFFASWCVPCRAEAPQLAALHAAGIRIVGIAVRDAAVDAGRFAAMGSFDRAGLDPRGAVQAALGGSGVPETWLVDGRGIVRARFRGDLHADDLPAVQATVAAAR